MNSSCRRKEPTNLNSKREKKLIVFEKDKLHRPRNQGKEKQHLLWLALKRVQRKVARGEKKKENLMRKGGSQGTKKSGGRAAPIMCHTKDRKRWVGEARQVTGKKQPASIVDESRESQGFAVPIRKEKKGKKGTYGYV